jgi:hypothetical protein
MGQIKKYLFLRYGWLAPSRFGCKAGIEDYAGFIL